MVCVRLSWPSFWLPVLCQDATAGLPCDKLVSKQHLRGVQGQVRHVPGLSCFSSQTLRRPLNHCQCWFSETCPYVSINLRVKVLHVPLCDDWSAWKYYLYSFVSWLMSWSKNSRSDNQVSIFFASWHRDSNIFQPSDFQFCHGWAPRLYRDPGAMLCNGPALLLCLSYCG